MKIPHLKIVTYYKCSKGRVNNFKANVHIFRVSEEIEMRGLDIKKHGEPAYPTAAYGHGWHKDEENKGEF